MTFTAAQLITRALQGIRVIGVGRHLTDPDATMALVALEEQFEEWRQKRRSIYAAARQSFTLVAGQVSRTIGPTGAHYTVTPKPTILANAAVLPVDQTQEVPIGILTQAEYFDIGDKTEEADYPCHVYMETGVTNNTLYFWEVPQTAATLYLALPTISGFADLTTQYTYPDGYHALFRTDLQIRIAEAFGKPVTRAMEQAFIRAEASIAALTDQGPPRLETDGALGRDGVMGVWYDPYSDSIRRP